MYVHTRSHSSRQPPLDTLIHFGRLVYIHTPTDPMMEERLNQACPVLLTLRQMTVQ